MQQVWHGEFPVYPPSNVSLKLPTVTLWGTKCESASPLAVNGALWDLCLVYVRVGFMYCLPRFCHCTQKLCFCVVSQDLAVLVIGSHLSILNCPKSYFTRLWNLLGNVWLTTRNIVQKVIKILRGLRSKLMPLIPWLPWLYIKVRIIFCENSEKWLPHKIFYSFHFHDLQ